MDKPMRPASNPRQAYHPDQLSLETAKDVPIESQEIIPGQSHIGVGILRSICVEMPRFASVFRG